MEFTRMESLRAITQRAVHETSFQWALWWEYLRSKEGSEDAAERVWKPGTLWMLGCQCWRNRLPALQPLHLPPDFRLQSTDTQVGGCRIIPAAVISRNMLNMSRPCGIPEHGRPTSKCRMLPRCCWEQPPSPSLRFRLQGLIAGRWISVIG